MMTRVAGCIALILGGAVVGVGYAQFTEFGKNKVQTREYQFQSYETEHFKVLFYPGGEVVAEFAARAAEDFYAGLRASLSLEPEEKIPLIIYLSPGQFSETNVITDLLSEGIGGFSELIKNRVVVPFNGSYRDLYHVIGHELTHIFEFQMFYRSKLAALLGAVNEFQVPLWVMEGFAEFQSGWVSVSSEVFMRDLVINNRLLSLEELNDSYGYLAYREGESFFRYVAERYGREKVYEFMNTLRSKRNLDGTFRAVFGSTVKKVGAEWERWLRNRYWPLITKEENFQKIAERLTDHTQDGSVYNTAPAIAPSGTRIAMLSDRAEYVDLYLISAVDGRVLRRLVRGERSGGFEGLHLLRPGVAWSPDEKLLAVVVTARGRDNIVLIDVARGREVRRISTDLDAIYTPKFSPDGKRLVFVGLKNGFSDIYLLTLGEAEPKRLTYDMYEDKDPAFSPGGDSIVFVSDRPDEGAEWAPGAYAVWLREENGTLVRLSGRSGFFGYPVFAHEHDDLLWVAADSSAQNICVYSLKERRVTRRTDFLGDASYLTLSRDDRKLVFAYFAKSGWDVAVIFDPFEKIPVDTVERISGLDTFKFVRSGLDFDRVKPVGASFSLDYLAGAASYTAGGGGFSGTIAIALSDILGNHRFEFYTDLYGDILNSNLILQYRLLPYRLDYGFALFQLYDGPYYYSDSVVFERINRGGQVLVSYPFDRFTRVEFGLLGMVSDAVFERFQDGWYPVARFVERTIYPSGAFVFDNTYWPDKFGPVRGVRMRVEAGSSVLSSRNFQIVNGDLRSYLRPGKRFVFASLLDGAFGFHESDLFYLGGELVRGYSPAEFYSEAGPGLGIFKFELRYPFVDRLKLAFPLPIDIRGVRGVAFLDGGLVFRKGMRLAGEGHLKDLKLGAGAGLRIPIWVLYAKLDFAKPLSETNDPRWKFIFELGYDF